MSQTPIEITCDGCGRNITYTGNSVDYRLELASKPMPSAGGIVTDMMIYPSIASPKHFCDLRCLDDWRAAGRGMIELTPSEALIAVEWLRWYVTDEGLGRLTYDTPSFEDEPVFDFKSAPEGSEEVYLKLVRAWVPPSRPPLNDERPATH